MNQAGRNGRQFVSKDKVHLDLEKERRNCPFSQEEITNLLDGGPEETAKRRSLEEYFFNSPEVSCDTTSIDCMSSTERYEHDIKMSTAMFKLAREHGTMEAARAMLGGGIGSGILPDGNPLGLHLVMFQPTLMGQATTDQQAKWLGRAWNMEIIGTYAQTEMGHGTFIRGLETTATYDPKSQEFVLNSPTLTSYKWWPGGLGKTVNHAIVMAQLITQGKSHGPHPFFVQLRDENTHQPLAGIKVGEIGPKLGMSSNDNGFLGFTNHRVPRDHLLMKHAQVLPDGTYVKPAMDKHSYGTMVFVRVAIVLDSVKHLQKAVTIATRYSAVRRQSELYPGEAEPQIIDYQTQQAKLFPALALAFGFHFTSQTLWTSYNDAQQEMESDNNFDLLPELHALSCGLKALVTQEVADTIDVLRRSCGGHGFMSGSNLPRLWGLVTASCTYEGENTVLQLQVARYLYKCHRQAHVEGKALADSVRYLSLRGDSADRVMDLATPTGMTTLFQRVARGQIEAAIKSLDKLVATGLRQEDAWNQTSIEFSQAAMAHIRYYVVAEYARTLIREEVSPPVKLVLRQLFHLMAIVWTLRYSGDFALYSGLKEEHLRYLRDKMNGVLAAIRPIAVSLVDSFDLHDQSILSTLGSYDGQVYQRMFDAAIKSPLNKKDVQPSFHKYIKPLLKANL